MSMQERVEEFHDAMGLDPLDWRNSNHRNFRGLLIEEEFNEVMDELYDYGEEKKQYLAKEMADLIYVLLGTAVAFNIDLNEVFSEVHRSNMSKLGPDGKAIYREDGKVLKGPNYKEADVSFVD